MEPTPRAGGCVDEVLGLSDDDYISLIGYMQAREHDIVKAIVYDSEGLEVAAIVEWGEACPRLREVRVRGCNGKSSFLLKAVEWPEVSKAAVENGCVEIVIPAEPTIRVERALAKLGVQGKLKIILISPYGGEEV